MSIFKTKSVQEFTDIQLAKWKELVPNINTNTDSMISLDASVISEIAYLLQQDLITQTNNSFIAYADGDELSNLGIDRGIPRNEATYSKGIATYGRTEKATQNYIIPKGNLISTVENSYGQVLVYEALEEVILYGIVQAPTNLTSVLGSSGTITNGNYTYSITSISEDSKETNGSELVVSVSNGLTDNSIVLSWDNIVGAKSYNIYIGGLYIGSSTTNTFTDSTGISTSIDTVPTFNDTGNISVEVPIISQKSGVIYNVGPSSIISFIETPLGIETVTNLSNTYGGSNTEGDDNYRDRLKVSLSNNSGKTTAKGYEATALGVEGVGTATVIHKVTDPINKITIYISSSDTANPTVSQSLLDEVFERVNLDENRAVCDEVVVEATLLRTIDIEINIIDYDSTLTSEQLTISIQKNLQTYFNSLDSKTLRIININNVIHDTTGVLDFTLVNPISNSTVDTYETFVLGALVINY